MSAESCWTMKRAARLGLLVGMGWSAERIAADPVAGAGLGRGAVQVAINRFGLSIIAARRAGEKLNLPFGVTAAFDAPARARGMSPELLAKALLKVIAGEPSLIGNVLDDGICDKTEDAA